MIQTEIEMQNRLRSSRTLKSLQPPQSQKRIGAPSKAEQACRLVRHFLFCWCLYGGVDVYAKPEEDVEPTHEDCLLYIQDEDVDVGSNQESQGPPQLGEEEMAILDQEVSLEELKRLSDFGVTGECPHWGGEEMMLDTWLVFDWRFRDQQWRRRARLVAREFRSGDASNGHTSSPTSSKWTIHLFLVLALVQQLYMCTYHGR